MARPLPRRPRTARWQTRPNSAWRWQQPRRCADHQAILLRQRPPSPSRLFLRSALDGVPARTHLSPARRCSRRRPRPLKVQARPGLRALCTPPPSIPRPPHLTRPVPAQNKNQRPPKGDVNATWKHDMFHGDRSLSARLTNAPVPAPKMNFGIADKALRDALGDKGGLSIKGASSRGNVVQVAGLAKGTTAADVEVCLPLSLPSAAVVLPSVAPLFCPVPTLVLGSHDLLSLVYMSPWPPLPSPPRWYTSALSSRSLSTRATLPRRAQVLRRLWLFVDASR